MNVSVSDAVQALSSSLSGLLPPVANPSLTPDVLVNPIKTHPAGIGGYIGMHESPMDEIYARRLKAQVVVRIKANDASSLTPVEADVTNALMGANPELLRSQGIFRITRDVTLGRIYSDVADGLDVPAGRDILFDVDFEYRRIPTEAGGVITSVPLDLLLNNTGNSAEILYQAEFTDDPLAQFSVLDDAPVSNGPSAWSFNSPETRIEQTSLISGGSNPFNPNKRGSYLVLQPSAVARQPANWILHAELGADSGGIGVVFNFQDINNYHFFIMSLPTPYRFMGKKVDGNFAFLDSGGQQNGSAYSAGDHSLRLVQQNGELQLAIDNTPVMSASETVPPAAGSVGFLCRNSATARFRSLRWLSL